MYQYRGKTALVTGASSGIGEMFAKTLAQRGMQVILVARSKDPLLTLAEELTSQHTIRAEVIAADLSLPEAPAQIFQAVQDLGLAIDLLVNNAGFGTTGALDTVDPARSHQQIMVNISAVVDLTHAFLPQMLAHGEGAIINVSSLASFMVTPYSAIYSATKAFVLSFSVALWEEYRQRGIRVLALCPGYVRTRFMEVSGGKEIQSGNMTMLPVERVVNDALKGLERGKAYVIPGRLNYLIGNMTRRLLPLTTIAKLTGAQIK